MRETVKRVIARQLAGLALAGLLVVPLVLFSSNGSEAGKSEHIQGSARVVDGDTIVLGELRIRLEGIDAPETTQTCGRRIAGHWRCGEEATRQLAKLIGDQPVRCEDQGLDKYGRTLGRCFAGDINLNAEMVRTGFAWAFVRYSAAYVTQETEARAARAGIWQGESIAAWDFRARAWASAETQSPDGCTIKGNVTNAGRIYHMPWSPWYEKVRMDQDGRGGVKGKRWFCSEDEAIEAGWRPALTR
jgi:endonuclease YncB( thermonuclease family)